MNVEDLKEYKLIYLASPYSVYEWGIEFAFKDICALGGVLLKKGVRFYSPIAHTHPIAIYGNVDPLDHNIWLPFDQVMMEKSDCLVVAQMLGWNQSRGIAFEIEEFKRMNKPIYMLDQWTLEPQPLVA